MTLTSYVSMACRMVEPQPEPKSSRVIPGCELELAQRQLELGELGLFECFGLAEDRCLSRSKYAQL